MMRGEPTGIPPAVVAATLALGAIGTVVAAVC